MYRSKIITGNMCDGKDVILSTADGEILMFAYIYALTCAEDKM